MTADLLADYQLAEADSVEVELLVPSALGLATAHPRLIEGLVAGATPRALILARGDYDVVIPWHAVALIRPTPPRAPHPAHQ